MDFWETVLRILDLQMIQPQPYGWFHILSMVFTVALTAYLCVFCRKWPRNRIRALILSTAVTVLILELYKQINFSFSYENGITFDYAWYAFPFQFCSTPMYMGLIA